MIVTMVMTFAKLLEAREFFQLAAMTAELVEAGADFLAVIAAIWDYPDGPAAAVKAFNEAIASASK